MSPVTHLCASWIIGVKTTDNTRDCRLVALAGVAPDLDGLGLAVDLTARAFGHQTFLWEEFHHVLLHGAFGAVLVAGILALFARTKSRVALLALITFHLHLVCDFVGSRGPSASDFWPILYFAPFLQEPAWLWSGQWRLDGWQNKALTFGLLLWILQIAISKGTSVVGVVSERADAVFVQVVRGWWRKLSRKSLHDNRSGIQAAISTFVRLAWILLFATAPTVVNACEPIWPFMQVVAGPAMLTQSLLVLVFVVLLKSAAFAKWQKKASPMRAFVFMLVGNLLTTVIGFIAGAMIASGPFWIVGVPIVFALCYVPAERLIAAAPHPRLAGRSPAAIATFMTGGLLLSCILFGFAQFGLMDTNIPAYWIGKLIAVYLALIISIALTAFWEEWTVWRLSRSPATETGFTQPVIKANLLVLLIVMLVSAAFMLPKRLGNHGFLAPMVDGKNGR